MFLIVTTLDKVASPTKRVSSAYCNKYTCTSLSLTQKLEKRFFSIASLMISHKPSTTIVKKKSK